MKIKTILLITVIFSLSITVFSQTKSHCDSAKLKVQIVHTHLNQADGEITFTSEQQSDWRVLLLTPDNQQSVSDSKEFTYKDLSNGYYDAVLYDKNKKYCAKHFKILIL